jgi:hypothetical protein
VLVGDGDLDAAIKRHFRQDEARAGLRHADPQPSTDSDTGGLPSTETSRGGLAPVLNYTRFEPPPVLTRVGASVQRPRGTCP